MHIETTELSERNQSHKRACNLWVPLYKMSSISKMQRNEIGSKLLRSEAGVRVLRENRSDANGCGV